MNAGIIAIILHQLPYQFDGIGVLSTIAFMIDFVLFIIFSAILLARLVVFRGQAYDELTSDPSNLTLLACWPIAWLTLAALVSLIVSTAGWGGHSFTIVGYTMWWIGVGWSILTFFFIFITLIQNKKGSASDVSWVPPTIVIPVVGIATAATTGAFIASYSFEISARMAVPVIIVSFMLVGMSVFVSLLLYSFLLYQLFATGFPEGPASAQLFLFIGPVAQSSAALQGLGSAASSQGAFGGYHKGTFLQQTAAGPLNSACVLIALMLAGLAFTWLVLAVYALGKQAFDKKLSWAPTWNSIIFPVGVFVTAWLQFSIEMDSPAWRTLTAAGIIILVILFLVNAGFTILKVAKGELLIVLQNPRVQQKDD